MTREETLNRLYDVQQQMLSMRELLLRRVQLERTYQQQLSYTYLQEHQAAIGTEKVVDKGKLTFMLLAGTCAIFFLLIDLLIAVIGGGFHPALYIVLVLCIVVIIKYRGKKSSVKTLSIVVLVGYTATSVASIIKGFSSGISWGYYIIIAIALVISFLISLVVVRIVNRSTARHNQRVDTYNQDYVARVDTENASIAEKNKQIRAQCVELEKQYAIMTANLKKSCEGWYPPKYCDLTSVQFFIDAFQNFKADTIKEAVNLYDKSNKHKELMQNQRQMSRKMDILIQEQEETNRLLNTSNMLQVMGQFQNYMQSSRIEKAIREEGRSISSSIVNHRGQ